MSIAHNSEATLSCPDCPKKFFRQSDLRRHSDLHRDFKYVCDICNAELISALGYKDHMSEYKIETDFFADTIFINHIQILQRDIREQKRIDATLVIFVHSNFSILNH